MTNISPVVGGIFLAALWAAGISTAVGLLLGSSTLVMQDVWKRFFPKTVTEKNEVFLSRLTVLGFSAVTYFLALTSVGILRTITTALAITASFTLLIVANIFWPKYCKKEAGFWTILASVLVWLAWTLFPQCGWSPTWSTSNGRSAWRSSPWRTASALNGGQHHPEIGSPSSPGRPEGRAPPPRRSGEEIEGEKAPHPKTASSRSDRSRERVRDCRTDSEPPGPEPPARASATGGSSPVRGGLAYTSRSSAGNGPKRLRLGKTVRAGPSQDLRARNVDPGALHRFSSGLHPENAAPEACHRAMLAPVPQSVQDGISRTGAEKPPGFGEGALMELRQKLGEGPRAVEQPPGIPAGDTPGKPPSSLRRDARPAAGCR